MKLLKIRLQGFGQFNEGLEVAFEADGLNVVIGRNEAGKSTLLNAVVGVLFGFRDLNQVRRYEPWDTYDAYAGELEILTDDGRVLRFRRDFKDQRAGVLRVDDGEEVLFEGSADPRGKSEEDHTYFRLLGEVLGIQDEAVFRSTVFFGQQGLQTSVTDQIRRLVSGAADMDYKGALHELHSRYSELTVENPWRSRGKARKRLIEETRDALQQHRTDWSNGRETLLRSLELEDELTRLQEELASAEAELDRTRDQARHLEELGDLLARRDSAERHYQEALNRRDNHRRYADRMAEIETRIKNAFGHLRNLPADFADMVRAHEEAREQAERDENRLAEETRRLEQLQPRPNVALGLVLLVLLALGGSAVGAVTSLGLPAGVILGLSLGLVGFAVGRNLGTGFKQERSRLQERIAALEASLARQRKVVEDVRGRTGSLLVGRSAEEVLNEYAGFQELREEKKRLAAAISALGGQEEVTRAFEEAAREKGAVDAGLERLREEHPGLQDEELADPARTASRLQELQEAVKTSELRVEGLRSRLEDARVELAGLTGRMDFDLAALQEDIREKEGRLADYDLERAALKEAIDTLDTCIKEFQEGDVFRLAEEMSGIFARITGEKYTRVNLGSSLDPVISRGDRVPISPGDLSQGAQDQLYFAMRVAMARHLSRNIRLPLFLDDPFVNFDEERLRVTREVLGHLDDQQVIMVTCDRQYGSWGEHVIDLDAVGSTGS